MFKTICVILLIVTVLVVEPLLTIWALNKLFPVLAIQYTLYTWSAVVLLGVFFRGNFKVN